ncbi:MAG TPA: MBL fold metallo-hydrolase [Vicinamibacteria bacterium]|nr:MBL fold metallo-hydrolase [Vicinamibacteria bacterium]
MTCTLAVASIAIASASIAQQDFSKVEIKTERVAPGVHMLIGSGGNIGVSSGEDGVLIIDDQYAPLTEKIRAAVTAISSAPIRFVVNTHWHGDHTGGNENMGKAGAVIVAHENVRRRMSTEQFNAFFDRTTPPSPQEALPVLTFTEDVSFHVNGDELHVFHVDPAHTDGDSIIHWKNANVFHMGDLFFSGAYPFIDLSSGGDVDGVIAAAESVLKLANDESKIIPGHGPLSTKKELQTYRDVLVEIRSRIQSHVSAGKSLEEVKAAKPTADWDAAMGTGFIKGEQLTEFVYRSIQSER